MAQTQRFEVNWQRSEEEAWESREFDTEREAAEVAQFWANLGAWNANFQAVQPGQDNRPGWTVRNGQRA